VTDKPAGWYVGLHYMKGHGFKPVPQNFEAPPQSQDFVYVDRIIGHVDGWAAHLKGWWKAVKYNGILCIATPDIRYAETPNRLHNGLILEQFRGEDAECLEDDTLGSECFIVLRKKLGGGFQYRPWRKKENHILISRFGAFGDALMVSSILPHLKEKGWTVAFNTMERGEETLRHDPHIDEWWTIEAAQVPEGEMNQYWNAIQTRFDKFVNMTHSVEGYQLKQEWRGDFYWEDAARRRLCAGSYLEHTHLVAGVPKPYRVKFYPSEEEQKWAADKERELGPFLLWCLNGSAPHKWYPHVAKVVTRLLRKTDLRVVLVGGEQSRQQETDILQAAVDYHGDASRIFSLVNTKSIRQAMALAQRARVVIGPETGVMNAVCLEAVPKVCLLSHSAASNLTDDWVNTTAIVPSVPCYPCHRLHNSHKYCPQDQITKAAVCAASIGPDTFEKAILKALDAGQDIAA
jgi:ADP-heptose:LPS heptosyltransferase